MRSVGYEGWTVKVHDRWFNGAAEEKWNADNICVAGFKVPCETEADKHGEFAPSISLAQLGKDIRGWPQKYDALDLTRMVRYAMLNPKEKWMYPKHYDELLRHIGGPMKVRLEHTDTQAFERWKKVVPPPPRSLQALQSKAASPLPPVRKRDRDTSEASKGPAKRGRPKKERQVENDEEVVELPAKQWVYHGFEEYVRGPPVLCPVPTAITVSSDESIETIFQTKGKTNGTNRYSAYAFHGPRTTPPYRPLHFILPPGPNDTSAWAENLRWSSEQFLHFFSDAVGWNESPEHLNLINSYREEQLWASDEWLEAFAKKQDKEGSKEWPLRRQKDSLSMPYIRHDRERAEAYWWEFGFGELPGWESFFD